MKKTYAQKLSNHTSLIMAASALLVTSYLGYRWYKRPQKLHITEDTINLTILNDDTNKEPKTVFIFSHGLDLRKNIHIIQAIRYIDNNIINGPCVTFNYQDSPRTYNFGQEQDMACLKTAYTYTRKAYPQAKIILVGLSRGATTILNLLAQEDLENITGIILESPFSDIKTMTDHIATYYLKCIPGSKTMLYKLVCSLPNYNPNGIHSIDILKNIKTNVPMLFICSKGDKVVPAQQTQVLVTQLKKLGKNIDTITVEQGKHSMQTYHTNVQQQTQEFIQKISY